MQLSSTSKRFPPPKTKHIPFKEGLKQWKSDIFREIFFQSTN